jgi:hypothetical protein
MALLLEPPTGSPVGAYDTGGGRYLAVHGQPSTASDSAFESTRRGREAAIRGTGPITELTSFIFYVSSLFH